ncbi:MAG: hypothetical protein ACT4QD_11095 [Acidobacteriota bacterium]
MKSIAASLVLAALLVGSGVVLWLASRTEASLAAGEHTLLSLRYQRAADELGAVAATGLVGPLLDLVGAGGGHQYAVARYWSGDTEGLAESDASSLKLLAANAEYWAVRTSGGQWQGVVSRLDSLAKRYADILRTDPGNEDAAYNYEFIVRLRTTVAVAKKPVPPSDPAATGLTVHGFPGAPPEDTDGKKFKMIVPMLPDERQEAEEAGRAARKVRKG